MVELFSSSALQSCTDLIGDQFSYVHNYNSNFENLKAQVEKLTLAKQRVMHNIQIAQRNGERLENDVNEWLIRVSNLIDEASWIVENEWKGNKRSLGGLCPNLGTRHQLSKKAARKVKAVVLLLSQGEQFHKISCRTIPEEISGLISLSQNPFISLRNYKSYHTSLGTEVEELVDARERVQHMIDVARRTGEAIYEDVLKWMNSVEELVDEARVILEGFDQKVKKQCFIGLCPDLITRYHLSNKLVRQLKAVVELRREGVFDKISYTIIPPNVWLTSTKVYENFQSRMATLEDLCNTLKDDHENIIGVYGMGGIGKTVLMKQIAAQAETDKLFDIVIFSELTPTPDIKKIQGDIADHLGLMFHGEDVDGRAIRLFNRLNIENCILVILDNIWTSLDLERIGIPVGDYYSRCKVLLTSRNQDVLKKMGSQKNFKVGILNNEEASSLFMKMAGDSAASQELQSLAIDIAKACGGLPIAIASIAMALRGKGVFTWRNALRSLGRPSLNNFIGILAELYSSIELSYNHLEGEELKSTFLLCSLMKYSDDVSITELLKYGMGLGLFKEISQLEEARSRLIALVHELKCSCLLVDGHSSEWFSIHDVVRLVGISIASREQHAFIQENEATDWLDKDALRSCKAISIHDSNIKELPEGLRCPQLNFFSLLVRNPFVKIPDNFFIGMTKLSVLNLNKMHLLSLPSSLCLLENLQTLCLVQCILGNIAVVGDLKNLEILSLSHSDIKLLPKDICQLTRLRMLDVSNCSKLKVISPNVISSLSCLEELYMDNSFDQWEVEGLSFGEGRTASLQELKHLTKLTSLDIHIKDAKILPTDLLSKLRRYRIFIGGEWDWVGEYRTSRTLKLKLNTSILEDGIIRQLNGIEELYLDGLQGVKNVLFELDEEGFPQLKHLHIHNNFSFQCFVDSVDYRVAFPVLESLFLHNLINLEKIFQDQYYLTSESFCKLKNIKVENCDKLKDVCSFSIARCLPQLEMLEVIECKNMEKIFFTESLNDIGNNKVNICSLTLKSLPQLKSSCLKTEVGLPLMWSDEFVLVEDLDSNIPFFTERVLFPMLQVLELSEINIQKIWPNRFSLNMSSAIPTLTHLILWGCGKLKYIFSSFISRWFVNLQHLEICHCTVLEEVITMEEFKEDERKESISFPRLECLLIKDLEKLIRFWSGNYIEFPSLKQLEIEQCPQFKAFIFTKISTDFFNEKVALPSLEKLIISGMDNLKVIWNHQLLQQSFVKLKLLKIKNCDNLLTIFPSDMWERFWLLESLTVTACGSLEDIFDLQGLNFEETHFKAQLRELHIHGLPKVTHVWKKECQVMLSLPKLRIMRVSRCQSLENLFPASVARNLFELEELEMINCGVEEIVSKEKDERAEATVRFVFPLVTCLKFSMLQQLRCFYPGTHTSEWKVLRKLEVYDCDNVKIFPSKFLSILETNEYQPDVTEEHPLFLVEKVFPNLEELRLGGKVMAMIWQSAFPEHLFRRVEVLYILKDESNVFPLHSFKRFHNLEKLILSHGSCREIFSHEEVEGHVRLLTQIKDLKLFELSNLQYMWKQESKLGTILQNLEILDVWWCRSLINLVPSSASFHNLTVLEVWFCKRLKNLVAFSTAKTLVQLKEMKICGCEMMTKVVAMEGNAIEARINFCKLKSLTLFGLESLKSFYPGNITFNFPSLEELFVIGCPNMYTFSGGVLSVPNLHEVHLNWAADVWHWDGDLNTTIQELHKKVNAETSNED